MTEEQREMTRTLVVGMRSLNDMLKDAGAIGLKVDLHTVKMFLSRAGEQIQMLDLAITVRNHPEA